MPSRNVGSPSTNLTLTSLVNISPSESIILIPVISPSAIEDNACGFSKIKIACPVVPSLPLVNLISGTTGQAIFIFEKPQALSSITDGEITGMRMIDSEGEILTREVKVKFVDGEPMYLEGTYIWKTKSDFDRFMRFANSYAKSNGLGSVSYTHLTLPTIYSV